MASTITGIHCHRRVFFGPSFTHHPSLLNHPSSTMIVHLHQHQHQQQQQISSFCLRILVNPNPPSLRLSCPEGDMLLPSRPDVKGTINSNLISSSSSRLHLFIFISISSFIFPSSARLHLSIFISSSSFHLHLVFISSSSPRLHLFVLINCQANIKSHIQAEIHHRAIMTRPALPVEICQLYLRYVRGIQVSFALTYLILICYSAAHRGWWVHVEKGLGVIDSQSFFSPNLH